MCYSVLIKTSLKELSYEFRTQIDMDSFQSVFEMRQKNPDVKIPRGLDRYFLESKDAAEAAIATLVKQFYRDEKARMLVAIGEARQEIQELASKPTSVNRKKIETREKRIKKLELRMTRAIDEPDPIDDRVFPFYYAPVIIESSGVRKLIPMRYRLRTPDGGDLPSQYNVFNARLDSLRTARSWVPIFGKNHLIFPFRRFYEWVERSGKKEEIYFAPDGREMMWAAGLYSKASGNHAYPLYSFAMVTDDPPEEVVQAGHDRCPIFLSEKQIGQWLNPKNLSADDLIHHLQKVEKPFYSHGLAA